MAGMRTTLALCVLAACGGDPAPLVDATRDVAPDVSPDARVGGHVLLFTRTAGGGFRHDDQIIRALAVLPPRLHAIGITTSQTEDALTAQHLVGIDAVVFLYAHKNDLVLAKPEFEAFIRGGGGFVGLHSPSDSESGWAFFDELIVARFGGHPLVMPAAIDIVAPTHPTMAGLPVRWTADDEWYDFLSNPSSVAGVTILGNLDETTYTGGNMGPSHPIMWAHEKLGGRVFYSALGHPAERWDEPAFVDHVVHAVAWVLHNR